MSTATITRGARRFVLASAAFLVAWQAAALAGLGRSTTVPLAIVGFVLHMVFGKAYSLVPSYFDRDLGFPLAPTIQFPLSFLGAIALVAATVDGVPVADALAGAGAVCWALGVAVFLGTLGWTIRDNPTGAETATGEHNADRRRVDRAANAVVPVALAYLGIGAYLALPAYGGLAVPVPGPLDGYPPRTSHLLAAGAAALLVIGLGSRLLPRFLVARPPWPLVGVALSAGAAGPVVLAVTLPAGTGFAVGAVVEAAAILAFAGTVLALVRRSDRRRLVVYGVLAGALAGAVGAVLGLWFAVDGLDAALVRAHLRANLLGFLGLTIVGVAYQFYPPSVGGWPATGDRTALASLGLLGGGLAVEIAGHAASVSGIDGTDPTVAAGRALALAGAALYAYLIAAAFAARAS